MVRKSACNQRISQQFCLKETAAAARWCNILKFCTMPRFFLNQCSHTQLKSLNPPTRLLSICAALIGILCVVIRIQQQLHWSVVSHYFDSHWLEEGRKSGTLNDTPPSSLCSGHMMQMLRGKVIACLLWKLKFTSIVWAAAAAAGWPAPRTRWCGVGLGCRGCRAGRAGGCARGEQLGRLTNRPHVLLGLWIRMVCKECVW